jgi:hypothetical protein
MRKSNKKLIIHAFEVIYADLIEGRFFLKKDKHRITYSKDRNMSYIKK